MHVDVPEAQPFFVAHGAGEAQRAARLGRREVGVVFAAALLVDRARGDQGGVVHQHVHRAKVLRGLGEHRVHGGAVGDIAGQAQDLATHRADLFCRAIEPVWVDITDHQPGAGRGQRDGQGAAQTRAGAGDQRDRFLDRQGITHLIPA
jgi:hypothetical protein